MAALVATLVASLLGPAACIAADATGPTLRFQKGDGPNGSAAFEVVGLPDATLARLRTAKLERAEWAALFAVYTGNVDSIEAGGLPAMLGVWGVETDRLSFVPRFPLSAGTTYTAVFDVGRLPGAGGQESSYGRAIIAEFSIERVASQPTTVVSQIYPSGETLPENLLKFYVHFSAPMSRGNVYRYVHLLDDTGAEVELPFLELDEQLWNRNQQRITFLLDPGRIKRGLKPHEDVGAALMAGRSYTLVIDAEWRDAKGNRLKSSHRKRFDVGAPDRTSPDPATWQIESPQRGSRDPLVVTFPEPLDQALLSRVIQVRGRGDKSVEGSVTIGGGETRWQFVPEHAWQRGSYRLVVATVLEDLAGNSIGRAFEVDLTRRDDRGPESLRVDVPFTIGDGGLAR